MLHEASSYRTYRPLYPAENYRALLEALSSESLPARAPCILDLGCGAGQSVESLMRAGFLGQITALDPDPEMLALAPKLPNVEWKKGRAEHLPFADGLFDAVACGSSYHWLDRALADDEMLRVLKPRGFIHLYEYQFPKSKILPGLNTWIREQFNQQWKLPNQKPRGRLIEISQGLVQKGKLRLLSQERIPMILELTPADFCGLLFSQARFLASEQNLSPDEVAVQRKRASTMIENFFIQEGRAVAEFDFALQSHVFEGIDKNLGLLAARV